jgi:hypothetical protein
MVAVVRCCSSCRFCSKLSALESGNKDLAGVCRRYPPAVIPVPMPSLSGKFEVGIRSEFPPVLFRNPCGEWKAIDAD